MMPHAFDRPSRAVPEARSRSGGAALVASLIFLVVISLIGASMFSTTTVEERVARNSRDREFAFAAAEAALRDAELRLTGNWQWPARGLATTDFSPDCTGGLCDARAAPLATAVHTRDFYAQGAVAIALGTITGSPTIPGLASARQPRYMIEMLCASCKDNPRFRITVQAAGRLPNTVVMLQEMYAPRNPLDTVAAQSSAAGASAGSATSSPGSSPISPPAATSATRTPASP